MGDLQLRAFVNQHLLDHSNLSLQNIAVLLRVLRQSLELVCGDSGSPSPCIYPDLMMRLPLNLDQVDPTFVWYWLQSPPARDFVFEKAKGTSSTMKKISQGVVMAIPFPANLGLPEQRRIVAELDRLQAAADSLKSLQTKTATELRALVPSIIS